MLRRSPSREAARKIVRMASNQQRRVGAGAERAVTRPDSSSSSCRGFPQITTDCLAARSRVRRAPSGERQVAVAAIDCRSGLDVIGADRIADHDEISRVRIDVLSPKARVASRNRSSPIERAVYSSVGRRSVSEPVISKTPRAFNRPASDPIPVPPIATKWTWWGVSLTVNPPRMLLGSSRGLRVSAQSGSSWPPGGRGWSAAPRPPRWPDRSTTMCP